jgi:hypothetical protein
MKQVTVVIFSSIALLLMFITSSPATIINCDFSQGQTGWNVDPFGTVSVDNGVATMKIQPFELNVLQISLYQSITLSPNVSSISFDVNFINYIDNDNDNVNDSVRVLPDGSFGQPNFLQVSFVPDTLTVDPTYFRGYDKNGVYLINSDLTTTPTTSATTSDGWYTFTQDISTLAGLSGVLEFDLFDRGDAYFDIAQVRNITESQVNPVPEPSTLLLLGGSLLLLPLLRFRKKT